MMLRSSTVGSEVMERIGGLAAWGFTFSAEVELERSSSVAVMAKMRRGDDAWCRKAANDAGWCNPMSG